MGGSAREMCGSAREMGGSARKMQIGGYVVVCPAVTAASGFESRHLTKIIKWSTFAKANTALHVKK
jgi:hypothetical protein